jgi:hypothetical protein
MAAMGSGRSVDYTNPEFLTQQWTAFWSAPLITLPLFVAVVVAVWWFRGTTLKGTIGGLKEQIATLEQRLKLAADKAGIAGQAQDELKKQIQTLEMAIMAKADNASLSALAGKVDVGFAKLAAANNAVSSTVSAALNVTEAPDVASFTVDTNSLDFGLYGATRKLDTKTRKKLQDGSSPFINIGAKKK